MYIYAYKQTVYAFIAQHQIVDAICVQCMGSWIAIYVYGRRKLDDPIFACVLSDNYITSQCGWNGGWKDVNVKANDINPIFLIRDIHICAYVYQLSKPVEILQIVVTVTLFWQQNIL